MRISHKTLYEGNYYNLGTLVEDMHNANQTVGSGKRINEISDDPVGLSRVLMLRSDLSNLDQIERNIGTGRSWLRAGETALTQVQDVIRHAKELSIQMKSATADSTDRAIAATSILGDLLQIVRLANTEVNGQYLFAGTKTDTQPFALDDEDTPTAATYSGNSGAFTIKTGKDSTLAVGHNGQPVFDGLLSTLIDLKGYLEANDAAGIGTCIDAFDTHLTTTSAKISEIGYKEIRLDVKDRIIDDLNLRYSENRSEIEDADIIEAITRLKSAELAYQAALTSSSKVMRLSLAQFI